ncbi:MAG TPA: nucleotidyl transferase AbiEii/AbiGii toxin family protein [Vicinamibacteria bacterium]
MSRLQIALQDIASYLQRENRGFALVGGLAVSAHAEPRFTRDIDLAVTTTDDPDTEALVRGLIATGYGVRATVEQESAGRLATVRLETPGEGPSAVVVDLLFASSGVEDEVVRSAEVLEVLPGLRIPVAVVGHLLALKVLSVSPTRPQDSIDILALLREAKPADIDLARRTAALIVTRGFGRGRDLTANLEEHLLRS